MRSTMEEEAKAILSAVVSGIRYGIKIRFPHALVMTLLFRQNQTVLDQISAVARLTYDHASKLAQFAAIYKIFLAILKTASRHLESSDFSGRKGFINWLGRVLTETVVGSGVHAGRRLVSRPPGYAERGRHALIAGALGGYLVWGRKDKVNVQINLYLLSRVFMAVGTKYGWHVDSNAIYPLFAATIWGLVMFLFEDQPDCLHPSLKSSMDEIYRSGTQDLLQTG